MESVSKTIQGSVGALFGKSTAPTVVELNVYPIKSCAEIQVDKAAVTARGFEHDRSFQVVSKVDGGWHFCTPRDKRYEKLFHLRAALLDGGRRLELSSPHASDKFTLDLDGAATTPLVSAVMGRRRDRLEDYGDGVSGWIEGTTGIDNPRLVGIPEEFDRSVDVNPDQGEELPFESPPVSLADEAPFLLTTRASLDDLNRRLEAAGKDAVDMRRFRPNIVVDGLKPWEEDALRRIRIGPVEFHVWQRCGRCTMTTIDRDTLKRCGEPLTALSAFRERANGQRNFGMHMIPVMSDGSGGSEAREVSVGDEVEILEYDEDRRAEWKRLFGGE